MVVFSSDIAPRSAFISDDIASRAFTENIFVPRTRLSNFCSTVSSKMAAVDLAESFPVQMQSACVPTTRTWTGFNDRPALPGNNNWTQWTDNFHTVSGHSFLFSSVWLWTQEAGVTDHSQCWGPARKAQPTSHNPQCVLYCQWKGDVLHCPTTRANVWCVTEDLVMFVYSVQLGSKFHWPCFTYRIIYVKINTFTARTFHQD